GYGGPIAVRVNPGFGHGHVQSCDTGGPSSKHGIWHQALAALRTRAEAAKLPIVELHAHIGTGPEVREFDDNLRRLVELVAGALPQFPDVEAVNLGGGIPHPYRPGAPRYDLGGFRDLLVEAAARLAAAARDVRLLPSHLDRRARRGTPGGTVRRGGPAVRERRRLHARRARAARPAPAPASGHRRSAGAARRGRVRRGDELELRVDRARA